MKNHSTNGGSPESLRRHNRSLVLQQIFTDGPVSRTQVAQATGLTGAAISRITRELLDAGLICEGEKFGDSSKPGRRSVEIDLAPDGAYVLGFGAGAFEQWVQLANQRGDCIGRRRVHLLRDKEPRRVIEAIARQAQDLVRAAKIDRKRLFGLGVAIAGVVNYESGTVLRSPNLGWRDVALRDMLGQMLRIPVQVESLHHALNLAEWRLGPTQGMRNIVVVNCVLGIGASVLADGRLIRGGTRAAGQIGHMHVAGASGLCTCGRRGCLDTVASGYAILTELGLVPERTTPREHDENAADLLLQAMERERAEDKTACTAFRIAGKQLGRALNAVWALADPETIVLTGPLAQARSYVEGVHATFAVTAPESPDAGPPVLVSTKSSDAAAVWFALNEFVLSQSVDLARLQIQGPGNEDRRMLRWS